MRDRQRSWGIWTSFTGKPFVRAEGKEDDEDAMARLDFEFQRDQLYLEVALDLRELLAAMDTGKDGEGKTTPFWRRPRPFADLPGFAEAGTWSTA